MYSLERASHTNSDSAEGPGKKVEKEPKSTAQRASDKGEAMSQFELNYGSKCFAWLASQKGRYPVNYMVESFPLVG